MRVDYIDHMGSDLTVVNAARVSFDKHTDEFKSEDAKLIRYLAKHNHWTPFAHPMITLRVQAPVPIRTQCFKHKQGFTENEISRRYVDARPDVYHPIWRKRAPNAKQGSLNEFPTHVDMCDHIYSVATQVALQAYDTLLREGVCPEQARFVLPQGMETGWYWTGSLAAYARFVKARTHEHAQREIAQLAGMVSDIVKPLFPESWKALMECNHG